MTFRAQEESVVGAHTQHWGGGQKQADLGEFKARVTH